MSQYLVDRFSLAFKAGLINRFGRIPSAEKFTIEFNFRNKPLPPISRETARQWIVGRSLPNPVRLRLLINWLELDASFIFAARIRDDSTDSTPIVDNKTAEDIRHLESYLLQKQERLGQAAINFVSPLTCILNKEGVIILVNTAWRAAAQSYPKLKHGELACEGISYLAVCENAKQSESAAKIAQCIRDVVQDNTKSFGAKYPCHSEKEKRWFEVKISAYEFRGEVCYVVSHMPITELLFDLDNKSVRLNS
jgi:hypothetical protein